MTEIKGTVKKVVFHDEREGHTVVRVACGRELHTCVGKFPSLITGEELRLTGEWKTHPRYGPQFHVTSVHTCLPSSLEGMRAYLASGVVRGIGPVYADKIIKHFGDQIFDVLDNYSARLEEVEGIGPDRRRTIRQSWIEHRTMRSLIIWLNEHGIGSSRAMKIYEKYGVDSLQTVKTNPYLLAEEIRGIGFKTADQMARKSGMAWDDPKRLRAGIGYLLDEAKGAGHCCLPEEELASKAVELLEVDVTKVAGAIEEGVREGRWTRGAGLGGVDSIYLSKLAREEEEVAAWVQARAKSPGFCPEVDWGKFWEWYSKRRGIELSSEQKRAVMEATANRIFILTGGPGVGKTTVTDALVSVLTSKKATVELLAPTGRASRRLAEATGRPAKTIHRALIEAKKSGGRLRADVVLIDESSMIDISLMAALTRNLPEHACVVFIGDKDQLPPVGPGEVLKHAIESGLVAHASLQRIYRQAEGSSIPEVAQAVNEGVVPVLPEPGVENSIFMLMEDDPERVAEKVVSTAAVWSRQRWGMDPWKDVQILSPMRRSVTGVDELNRRMQSVLNPVRDGCNEVKGPGFTFREGDKVIQTTNNYDKEVFNGEIGRISAIVPDTEGIGGSKVVVVDFPERTVEYRAHELDELQLAYAVTVHKSQGSEFKVVVIPVTTQHAIMLQRKLIYTAITRGKQRVVLVGQKKALGMAVRNAMVRPRYSGLLERICRSKEDSMAASLEGPCMWPEQAIA